METPADYKCQDCGAAGVKLWRPYQTFSIWLRCVQCTHKVAKSNIDSFDLSKSDQIGWFVPAVPDGHGNYWGYTSVPDDGVAWWKGLPTGTVPRRKRDRFCDCADPLIVRWVERHGPFLRWMAECIHCKTSRPGRGTGPDPEDALRVAKRMLRRKNEQIAELRAELERTVGIAKAAADLAKTFNPKTDP